MAKRKMTLQIFDIESRTTQVKSPDFSKFLYAVLNKTNTINERFMKLHQEDGVVDGTMTEGDFIPYFSMSGGFLFGSFVRLRPGEGTSVSNVQLSQKTVSMNEMVTQSEEGVAGSIKDYVFFCIFKGHMVMSSAKNNRKALDVYINWLFRENGMSSYECTLNPKHKTENTIEMGDIKRIQIAESYFQNAMSKQETKVMQVKKDILREMINDVQDMKALALEDILTATIHLKINRKELKKNNGKALNTLLKIVDSDDIQIIGKGAKRIKGTDYLVKVERKFEIVGKSLNEPEIETEMRNILRDIDNGKVVN